MNRRANNARRILGGATVLAGLLIGAPGAHARSAGPEAAEHDSLGVGTAGADSTRRHMEEQEQRLDELYLIIDSLNRRVAELEADSVGSTQTLEERLKRLESSVEEQPEVPPDVVSAGDFPGSMRIPGTDAALKIGGLIWAGFIETLDALGSEDRFLTHTIPVEGSAAAAKGPRLSFWANPSRFNFDLRTPTKVGQVRAFIEGDFASTGNAFRLRHAYAQYGGFILGHTWSTFSDPEANHQDLDFEGINAENVQRQAQIRYATRPREDLKLSLGLEQPIASFFGAASVSQVPDFVTSTNRSWEDSHLQLSAVLRQLRGEPANRENETVSAVGYGASVSGDIPVRLVDDRDRVVFQATIGRGISRYLNDLNSAGGQDAVYDSTSGEFMPLSHWGYYVALEHHWRRSEFLEGVGFNDLRSSLIWGYVNVDNLEIQGPDAYHRTHRVSLNLIWSPVPRLDAGAEYIWGQRENKNGANGQARQLQFRTRLLF